MDEKKYTVGKMLEEWGDEGAQNLTFIVTEECNLRCKYCYVTHKEGGKVMSFEVAKKFIDLALSTPTDIPSVILDFIGGEPLLEAELIDRICDYFKKRAFELQHPWYWRYRISIGTNGVNYSSPAVQKIIEKNKGKIAVGITLDGTKEKHDMQRIFPDGSGSYDAIMKNIPLWLEQFPGSTKVTFSSDDLPLLKESIIHLWELGITDVAANVVFEDAWKEGDDQIFENQLRELADYIIEHELFDKYKCTLFEKGIGNPYTEESLCHTSCGAGKMLAVNYEGNIYPCVRYYDYSLDKKPGYIIGNVEDGLSYNALRTFGLAMAKHQCDEECRSCEVASGCSYCLGFCYDDADTPTSFQRAKYICKMHKARVRANDYYFTKLENLKGIQREVPSASRKSMLFLLGDDYVSFCSYRNDASSDKQMDRQTIAEGLRYAAHNFYKPVFVHSSAQCMELDDEIYAEYDIMHMIPASRYREFSGKKFIPAFSREALDYEIKGIWNVVLTLNQEEISGLSDAVLSLMKKYDRINLKILKQNQDFPYRLYKEQLETVRDEIVRLFRETGEFKEINAITDTLFSEAHEVCGAGDTLLAYAPDGRFYICPAFYTEGQEAVGNTKDGIDIKNGHLYSQEYAPLCSVCDTYQCENCIFLNQQNTREVNISPDFQCIKSHIERDVSYELYQELKDEMEFIHVIEKTEYIDPYAVSEARGKHIGFYKEKDRKQVL